MRPGFLHGPFLQIVRFGESMLDHFEDGRRKNRLLNTIILNSFTDLLARFVIIYNCSASQWHSSVNEWHYSVNSLRESNHKLIFLL